jgi:DNA-binding transcriptional MerR regulator
MSRLQQGISKLNNLGHNSGASGISRLTSPTPQARYILPNFIERTTQGFREYNPYAKLFEERTGCKVETIRFYERARLLPAPARSPGGYRLYGDQHLKRLTFIRRARSLGFSIDGVRTLLKLADEEKTEIADNRGQSGMAEETGRLLNGAITDGVGVRRWLVGEP